MIDPRRRAPYLPTPSAIYTIIGFGISFMVLFTNAPFSYSGADSWEHLAALKALIDSPFAAANPHVANSDTSARFMPYFVAAGAIGHILDADVFSIYRGVALINILALLIGAYLFAKVYWNSNWSPVLFLLSLVGAWGLGIIWSNSLSLRSIPYVAGYPSMAAMGLMFLTWQQIIRFLGSSPRSFCWVRLVGIMALTTLTVLTHLLTGAVMLGGAVLLIFTKAAPSDKRFGTLAALVVGTLLVEAWPYYSTLGIITHTLQLTHAEPRPGADLDRWQYLLTHHPFYKPSALFPALGLALIFPFLAVYYLVQRRYLFGVLGFLGLIIVYLSNLFVPIPLGHRALLFAAVFGCILLTSFLTESLRMAGNGARKVFATAVLATLGLHIAFSIYDIARKTLSAENVVQAYQQLAGTVPAGATIMARQEVGWPLPAFSYKVVSPMHPNPFLSTTPDRNRDTRRFFATSSAIDVRLAIARKWGATYLLLENSDPELSSLTSSLCATPAKKLDRFTVCRLRQKEN